MLRVAFVSLMGLVIMPLALRDALGALVLYLWFAYFRPDFWVWDRATFRSFNISLILGIFLVLRAALSGIRIRLDVRVVMLLLLLALSTASTVVSDAQAYAWPWWEDYAKALILVYLISALIEEPSQFRLVILVIAISLGLEAAKQGWVTMLTHPGGRNDNRSVLLGDNNAVAVGMWMLSALFIALANTATTTWEKRLHQFFLIGVAYRALTTYSRGGFLTAGGFCLVYLIRSKHKVRSLAAMTVVGVVLLSMLPQEFWDRMSTINTSTSQVEIAADTSAEAGGDDADGNVEDASAAGRLHFWRVAVDMALANPVLGVGLNSFSRFYDVYDSPDRLYGRRRAVHSMWFGTLAELGFPGFLLFVSIMFLAITDCVTIARRSKRGELPPEMYHYAVALQAAFAGCMVGGTFLSFQYNEMLWHFIGLTMALRGIAMKATVQPVVAVATSAPEPPLLDPHAPRIPPPRRRPAGAPA